jgi:hypothetical protein
MHEGLLIRYFGKFVKVMWIGLTHMVTPMWLEVEGCTKCFHFFLYLYTILLLKNCRSLVEHYAH